VVNDSADITSSGRAFHVRGPTIGKARLPTVDSYGSTVEPIIYQLYTVVVVETGHPTSDYLQGSKPQRIAVH